MQQQKVVSWLSQHNFPHGLVSFADGLSTDPLGHKATYLKNLIQEHGVIIHASYGSSKDISVYTSIGLKPKQIFVVGKVSKKHHSLSTVLQDGYAAHLTLLLSHGGSRPAQGNARMVIPRGYFGLPGQNASLRRRSNETSISSPVRGSIYVKRKVSQEGHIVSPHGGRGVRRSRHFQSSVSTPDFIPTDLDFVRQALTLAPGLVLVTVPSVLREI
nr:unnamed protein product [Timema californicum]